MEGKIYLKLFNLKEDVKMRKARNIILIITAITAMLILTVLSGSIIWAMIFHALDKIVDTALRVMHLIT